MWATTVRLEAAEASCGRLSQELATVRSELRSARARMRDAQRELDAANGTVKALTGQVAHLSRLVETLANRPAPDITPALEKIVDGFTRLVNPPYMPAAADTSQQLAGMDTLGFTGAWDTKEGEFYPDVELDPTMPAPTRGGWVGAPTPVNGHIKDLGNYPPYIPGSGNPLPPHEGGIVE